jgi:hypothetical protein
MFYYMFSDVALLIFPMLQYKFFMLQHTIFGAVVHFCDVALYSFSVCFCDVALGSLFVLLRQGGTVGESSDAGGERVQFYSQGRGSFGKRRTVFCSITVGVKKG